MCKCKDSDNDSNFYTAPNGAVFTSKEIYQTQLVRLADVFFIGPILIYAATFKMLPMPLRLFLWIVGVLTIIYNGNNYIKEIK